MLSNLEEDHGILKRKHKAEDLIAEIIIAIITISLSTLQVHSPDLLSDDALQGLHKAV